MVCSPKSIVILLALLIMPEPLLAESLQIRHIKNNRFGLKATVILVAAKDNQGFFAIDVPRKAERDNISKHWKPSYAFLINGGYFKEDFSPVGFVRIGGRTINGRRSKHLSGFIAINERGTLRLLTRTDELSGYGTVIQSGPHLVDPGGSIGIKADKGQIARRTVVGATRDHAIIVAVTEPISLSNLARAMLEEFPSLDRLLNLDGGPSTALKTESTRLLNTWPVRNYIGKTSANKRSTRESR